MSTPKHTTIETKPSNAVSVIGKFSIIYDTFVARPIGVHYMEILPRRLMKIVYIVIFMFCYRM